MGFLQSLLGRPGRPRFLSPPLKEGSADYTIAGRRVPLEHSVFNPAWLAELKIVPRVILDLGAYDGGDAVRLKQSFPAATVVAVEADPARYAMVAANVAGGGVLTVHAAIQERDGEVDWFGAVDDRSHAVGAQGSIFAQSPELDRKFPFIRQSKQPGKVPGKRLDTLCRELGIETIDLLHMDIQGAEQAALRSLGNMIGPGCIFLEMQPEKYGWIGAPSRTSTADLLARMGYAEIANFGQDRLYVSA